MNLKQIVVVMGCTLMAIVLVSPSFGSLSEWSYRIALLSTSALSDDGERFLVGCENGEYFVFDRYGNLMVNRTFEQKIYAVDIAENGNMIFGLDNGFVFVDKDGEIKSKEFTSEPVLSVSIARNGLFAVAGTQKEIFLINPNGLRWKSEIMIESTPEERSSSASDQSEISISEVAISAWGSSIAVATQEKVFLFGVESGIYKARVDLGITVTSLAILPDGSEVAIGTEGGTLLLCDMEGKRKFSIPEEGSVTSKPLPGSICSIAASSEQILVGTSVGNIVLFNRDGNFLFDEEIDGSVKDCDISDDGKFMVILDSEGNVSFFNILKESGWKFAVRDPISVELSEDGKYVGITGGSGIYLLNNWENTFENTGYFPYVSRGSFSLEDLYIVWSYPVRGGGGFDYGDINGDGQNEVVFGSGTKLVVLDHRGELIWEKQFPANIEVVRLLDLTEDAVPEILVGFDDGRLNMDVLSGKGEHLASFDFMDELGVTAHPDEISMEPIIASDIDDDEIVEIVSGIKIEYEGKPGGILVFEYPSGKIQSFYQIAPCQTSYVVTDMNNDGNLELVLGSYSTCKGTAVKERDDCHVYVMVVDLEGNEKWVKEVDYGFRELFVAVSDVDGDGQKEIVGTVGSSDGTYGKLFTLDDKGKYIYEREFDYSIRLGGIVDFEKDGYQEIVVTNSERRVVMYDHNFVTLRQFEAGQKTPYVKGIADLVGDGTLEIVLVTDDGKFIIIDSSFAELVSMNFDGKPEVIVAKISGCAVDLLVHSSDKIELYSLKRERAYLCPLIKKGLEYPEIYFEKAETHYINLNFKESREYYRTARKLYEEAENTGKAVESARMLERTEYFSDAIDKADSGRKNLEDNDFKKTVNDLFEAKEWLQPIKNDLFRAKILFESLLENEEYTEVKEWIDNQVNECGGLLLICDELENAFDNFENGKKEFERRDYERAREYFMSVLQPFDEYGFEQLGQDSRTSLEEIEEYLKSEEMWVVIFRWSVVLVSWTISLAIIYKSSKYLQDVMYRNDNYSTFDSLLYTVHIKRFPKFSRIKNPYYAGKPIRDPSMFFGRKYLHDFLKGNLVSPGQNPSIIFYGERKTGKTSILFQIENGKLNLGREFIPVYIDMNKMIIKDDYEFLLYVISLIKGAIEKRHIQILTIPLEKENPHLIFKDTFLPSIADSVGKRRILFLIDEYEAIEKKVSEGKLSKDIVGFLKSVIEPEIKLDFIFTGSKKIEDLTYFEEWSNTLGASASKKIRFLREKDATNLIKGPVAEKVWYTKRAVEKLLEMSGRHPYILQHICFNLVTLLNENESFTVDTMEVEEVIQDILKNPMPQIEFMWTRFTKNQQLLVSFLAGVLQKGDDSISEVRIIDEFRAKNIKFSGDVNTILKDLENLVEKDILKREKYRYSFCADIFRQFVAECYPF